MNNNGMVQTYSVLQKQIIGKLAKIEQEDADRCSGCGGEDCICCEYYLDRQKWVEPDELFADNEDNDDFDRYDFVCSKCGTGVWEWCDICNTCVDCCTCEKDLGGKLNE